MAQKKSSPAAGQRGPGSGIRIDSERPPIAQTAPKIQKNLPPLLMLAEGRKPRPRKATVIRAKESVLHFAVAEMLRRHADDAWRWTHVPLGEKRDARTGAKLKKMGAQPGWPDFILIDPHGRAHFIELKRVGETLSEEQEELRLWATRYGIPFVVAHDTADVFLAFKVWRVLRADAEKLIGGGAHD